MKRLLTLLLCAMLCLAAIPCLAEEVAREFFASGDYEYVLAEDGTAEITRYYGEAGGTLDVPAQLDGHAVTGIGDGAFGDCSRLTDVTLPEGLKRIGEGAFCGCSGLKTIALPDSVTEIDGNPFIDCDHLKSIHVSPDHPALAIIDGVLFSKADKRLVCYPARLEQSDYTVPEGIESIGDDAFYGCRMLRTVTLPDCVVEIGENPFAEAYLQSIRVSQDNPGLATIDGALFSKADKWLVYCPGRMDESYTVPRGIKIIGERAFSDYSGLKEITLPDTLVEIRRNPFCECYNLERIHVSPDHPALEVVDGVLFSKADKRLVTWPFGRKQESYAVPQGTRIIGDEAFYWNPDRDHAGPLTEVTLPEGLERIGERAFYYQSIEEIALPEGLAYIGDEAFAHCNFTKITLGEGLKHIGEGAFARCWELTEIALPEGLTYIGDRAFYKCTKLGRVTLGEGPTRIGAETFWECTLYQVTLPASVKSIAENAFVGKPGHMSFSIPRGSWAVQYCKAHGYTYTYTDANDWLND